MLSSQEGFNVIESPETYSLDFFYDYITAHSWLYMPISIINPENSLEMCPQSILLGEIP